MKTCQNLLFQMQWQVIHKLVENSRVSEVKETTIENYSSRSISTTIENYSSRSKELEKT